jgi:hypothetical protein
MVVSGDHRLLSDRGWKHVTGTEWTGPEQRPHLTLNNCLLGVGRFVAGPKQEHEYRRGYLCGMVRGDALFKRFAYLKGTSWNVTHGFRLALTDAEPLARTRDYLAAEGVPTRDRVFSAASATRRELRSISADSRRSFEMIERLIEWPDKPGDEWIRGFLAGIFDAEGHLGQVIRISTSDPEIIGWTTRCLAALGLPYILEPPRPNGVRNVR